VVGHKGVFVLHTVELSILVLNDLSWVVSGGEISAHRPRLTDRIGLH
jgi:hypothetical protein